MTNVQTACLVFFIVFVLGAIYFFAKGNLNYCMICLLVALIFRSFR